ncbi:hypothetical protein QP904_01935, partial [Corynebacterium kefirresidentii]|nr:hypothetical protein [Corynebacterium kefirresidentii]
MIETWRREIPGEAYAHGQIWTQASASDARKHTTPNTVTHFQYSYDRARRGLRGIKEQVAKAKRAGRNQAVDAPRLNSSLSISRGVAPPRI